MKPQHEEFCPAHADPSDQPVMQNRWRPALLLGAVLVVPGVAVGVLEAGWNVPTGPLTAVAIALALTVLYLGVPVVRHFVAVQSGGHQVRVGDRRWVRRRRVLGGSQRCPATR